MNRRRLLQGLTTVFLATPWPVDAQPTREKRVGVLGVTPTQPVNYEMFKQGVEQAGSFEGHRVIFVEQHADGTPDRLPDAIARLLRARPDVIYARGPASVSAAVQATRTIPIVAVDLESDPVARGFAKSLPRPGGNVTGVFLDLPELSAKQLQLIREIIPHLSRVALLGDSHDNAAQLEATEHAARKFGIQAQRFESYTVAQFETALEGARRAGAGAVLIFSSPVVFAERAHIAAVALEKRLPTVSLFTEFAEAGGLLTYGPSIREASRRCGVYVGKILNGARPAEMPIERPESFDLVINVKTARAIGVAIPPAVLLRANQVIE
jgi:putative tryptophan/tyrosine transport system substrate-binding protein